MTWARGAVVALLVVVSLTGCSTVTTDNPTETPSLTPTTSDNPTETVQPTETTTPESTPEPVDPDNPYQSHTLQVYIHEETESKINFESATNVALDYWGQNDDKYLGYPISFELTEREETADIKVSLLNDSRTKEVCGEDILGCATLGNGIVFIKDGYRRSDTIHVLKHELGHALGLTHDDEPAGVMAARYESQPISAEYTYDIEPEGDYHPGAINRQVTAGLGYLADGADGTVGTDVGFVRQREGDVDIEIEVTGREDTCGDDLYCYRTGEDGETFKVSLGNVKQEAVGWVVAWSVFRLLEVRGSTDGYPEKLNPESDVDPTKSWWR